MPSPVGHALAGIAAGYFVEGRAGHVAAGMRGARAVAAAVRDRRTATWAALGMLADADFVFGIHSMMTHSIGAVALVAVGAGCLARRGRWLVASLATGAAYASHPFLDWLGTDGSAPYGVMALWPINREFYLSGGNLFLPVCRQYWLASCWLNNMQAVLWEIATLAPIAALAIALARGAGRRP